jgi:hypothetical protein
MWALRKGRRMGQPPGEGWFPTSILATIPYLMPEGMDGCTGWGEPSTAACSMARLSFRPLFLQCGRTHDLPLQEGLCRVFRALRPSAA